MRSWTWDPGLRILMPILAANFASDSAGGPANALAIFFIARAVPRWWPNYRLLSCSTQHSDGNPHPAETAAFESIQTGRIPKEGLGK